jgi:hypothetical protein
MTITLTAAGLVQVLTLVGLGMVLGVALTVGIFAYKMRDLD